MTVTTQPSCADGRAARPARAVLRDSLTVGVGVGVSGVAFGAAGAGAHLTVAQTCALSLLVFTGASQFALVAALAAGAAPVAAVAGALFLGIRNAFYGMRLAERLRLPVALRPLAAQLVIDETAAVTLAQPDRRAARLGFTATGVCLFALWNLTTLLGALGAGAVGDPARYGLDAAGPAVFLALLAPRLRDPRERRVAVAAVVLVLAGTPLLPTGVPVLLALAAVPLAAVPLVGPAGRGRSGR
ncbi:branched-chain amino acid ABC transporter permease [Kitasatospora phosalacinea]|uniref:Branched-chain amino acid ABC transporter permease n=1 Tax=Kitasatospora phosalacinea TaxID=2065 RepID=A0A9W6QGD4_9ACTN|nr:AzlC family ABC transporter permease [Kitasatospora phosalacinea]GLW73992.1 branched-chain amino acid ABC transporter permease [Kitasatospora phosalacinea]